MKLHTLLLPLAFCLPALLPAKIVLKTPAHDETISTMAPELRAFLKLPTEERHDYFNDRAKRSALRKVRDAQPYVFTWDCTEGERGTFTVVVSEKEDFSRPSPALVLPPQKGGENAHEALIVNFELGKTYHWKVVCESAGGRTTTSATGRFRTDAFPPRQLTIPAIGNIRDLGGRRGLDGRMLRQGLIYRSAGLNEVSPDFNWDRKKWKKENVADFTVGDTRLTPASIEYINAVLRWKTDLDLRSPGEVATMTESPAGPGVQWVHLSAGSYNGIFNPRGAKAMADSFRLFCDRANYPIDFHCTAGADRAGSLAYVLLGVDADEAAGDWEMTANSYALFSLRSFDRLAGGFDAFGEPGDPLHKKVEAYLYQNGITPEEVAAFRSIMLKEPGQRD